MKNSASDVFCLEHATSYQHAFGYIRQLAILLRNSMKVKSKVGTSFPVRTLSDRSFSLGSVQTGLQLAICTLRRFLVYSARTCLRFLGGIKQWKGERIETIDLSFGPSCAWCHQVSRFPNYPAPA